MMQIFGTPMSVVQPLHEHQRSSQLHGHNPWLTCEVALSLSWTLKQNGGLKTVKCDGGPIFVL
jgi:hypothetical protein